MPIRVRYFASLRERIGRAEDSLDAQPDLTVAEVWATLQPDRPLDSNTLAALNQEYVEYDRRVSDGDEVAFFPPVTGG